MEHVVKEANSRVDRNGLGFGALGGVCGIGLQQASVGIGRKVAAVKVNRELNFGLVRVSRQSGPAY